MKQIPPASPAAETAKNSPLPWLKAPCGPVMRGYGQSIAIADSQAKILVAGLFHDLKGGYAVAEANAALIIRAVNSESALRAALERLIRVAGVELDKTRPDVMEEARRALSL